MSQGVALTHPLETLLMVQRSLTVALSSYNAFYFATYRSHRGRRRLGAVVLTFINLAIGAESLAFGLLPSTLAGNGFTAGCQVIAASLSLAVATVIATLILRQRIRRR